VKGMEYKAAKQAKKKRISRYVAHKKDLLLFIDTSNLAKGLTLTVLPHDDLTIIFNELAVRE